MSWAVVRHPVSGRLIVVATYEGSTPSDAASRATLSAYRCASWTERAEVQRPRRLVSRSPPTSAVLRASTVRIRTARVKAWSRAPTPAPGAICFPR